MDDMKHRRLQELDRSDFEIVDGEPDIRGWDVKLSSGQEIGEVEELILDAQERKVRYMVVELDDEDFDLEERKVLIPIGLAQLDKEEDDVIIPNLRVEQLKDLPTYDPDHLTPEVERRTCEALGRTFEAGSTGPGEGAGFYNHEYYNDSNLYKNRSYGTRSTQQGAGEPEYEQGLRLWERRSEGGILPNEGSAQERDAKKESEIEMVRNRRNAYEQRKTGGLGRDNYNDDDLSYRSDSSTDRP